MSLSLALRIKVHEQQKAEGAIRQFAGSMDVVSVSAQKATTNLRGTAAAAQQVGVEARQARALGASIENAGQEANSTAAKVRALAATARDVKGVSDSFKEVTQSALEAGKAAHKVWDVVRSLRAGNPISLFNAAAPDGFKRKVGMGAIGAGIAEGAIVGSNVAVAGRKELRLKAIEGITGSKDQADTIYRTADEASVTSIANLDELVIASKTLAKDRQFSGRYLRASDDLAAAGKDEGTTPQDVARALGRLRAGDHGEAFERLRDFGISRPELEAKGLKFDSGGALEDKTKEGTDRALEAVVSIIEERFGGLSEKLAAETFEGAVSNLEDAIGRARTALGESLIPPITWATRVITGLVSAFNSLPEPVHAVIGYAMGLNAIFLVFIGTLIMFAGPIGTVLTLFKILTWTVPVVNRTVGQLVWSLLTHLIPSLGATATAASTMMIAMGAMALAIITAAAIIKGIEWYNDAKTKSDAEMESEGPVEGFIARMGRRLGDNSETISEEDRKLYEHYKRTQEKRGRPVKSLREWKGNSTASDEASGDTPEQIRAAKEAEEKAKLQGQFGSQIAMLQSGDISAVTPSISTITGVAGVSGDGDIAAQEDAINAMEAEMDDLRAQLRRATGKENADLRKTLQERIAQKGIQMREARQALAAGKRSTSAAERDRAKAEREAKKRDKEELEYDQLELETKEAETEESFNTRIAALEAQRDAARAAKNEAREAQLKFEIETLEAEKNYALAKIRADQTGLADERKRDIMLKVADTKRKGALARAQIALNAARNKGLDMSALRRGGILPGLPAGLATRAAESAAAAESGGMFNPYANVARDDENAMTRMIGSPQRPANMNSLAANARARARDWVATAKGRIEKSERGKLLIRFEELETQDPAVAMGGRL